MIQLPLGTERPNPSQVSAQQDYGKSGCDPEESVHGESAISPDPMSWVSELRVANLVRPARDDAHASALGSQPVDLRPGGLQVDLGSASSSRVSLGIFPPSGAFNSSARPNPAPGVSFALPLLGDDEFGEGDSVAGEAAPLSEGLSHISKLLSQLCPESVPSSVASDSRACQFKGLFSNLAKPPKEHLLVLFHRVSELLLQSCAKFVASATAGKATVSAPPFKKRPLAVSGDPEFGRPAVANPALPRIIGNLLSSRSAGVQFFELARMKSVARQALQSQSVVFWLFNAFQEYRVTCWLR